jgi:branched-chain amino acid transport system substrate-binding protein
MLTAALAFGACRTDEVDPNNDPNQTRGVTDAEIRIGTLLPLSGNPAAAWGIALGQGMQVYFDYINDNGGIYGRKLKLFVEDNQYSGPVAAEAVRKLVEQDDVFAIQGSLGTEAHTAIYNYLEERGIPDLFILSGNHKWTYPTAHNRFTALMDYETEGRLFARYMYQTYNGKRLGILAQNDDYGKEGEIGIKDELKTLGADISVTTEYYDATQSDVTSQVQRLKNANIDVMMFWGQPIQAANMIKTARQTLSWDVPMILNSTNAQDIMFTLAGPENIEGTVSAVIGGQAYQTEYPEIQNVKNIMAKYAPGVPFDNTTLSGYIISAGVAAFIKQAGPDLTRDGLIAAMESLCQYFCDTCLVPASTSPADHRLVEAEILARATFDNSTNPPGMRWQPFGDPFDFESTKECTRPTPPPGAEDQPGGSIPTQ